MCFENSEQGMKKKTKSANQWRFSTDLDENRWHTKQQLHLSLVTCILADFCSQSFRLGMVYSQNCITILCIKVWNIGFLGINLLLGENTFLGKICWREDAAYWCHFLSQKNQLQLNCAMFTRRLLVRTVTWWEVVTSQYSCTTTIPKYHFQMRTFLMNN